ncbi:MAG: hypothetical protein FWC80_00455 [Firmicutes bacterium]|nr:hypothetical protein [Bacillota bacterium]
MNYKPPGFLVVKPDVMYKVLAFAGKTVLAFAEDLDIEPIEAYSLLSGEKMGKDIAKKFIIHYKAEYAHRYIDWEILGLSDPYLNIRKRNIRSRNFYQCNTAKKEDAIENE